MTLRRTKDKTEEVEVIESPITNPWLKLLLSTHGWRLVIIVLIASQHPIGRGILSSVGFDWQDSKKIDVAATEAKAAKSELTTISDSVKTIDRDVSALKANNAILNEKVDNMKTEFSGFKIDFNKWKPEKKEP